MYIYLSIYIYICVCAWVCVYIYMYTHIYIYMYISLNPKPCPQSPPKLSCEGPFIAKQWLLVLSKYQYRLWPKEPKLVNFAAKYWHTQSTTQPYCRILNH